MGQILIAVAVLSVTGAVCALLLILASKFMYVPVDEKFPKIRECLPGANCGACGYAGCDGYANALAAGEESKINKCVPGAAKAAQELAAVLGVEFEEAASLVAVVQCGGDCEKTKDKMDYQGIKTCTAAKLFYGGKGACSFGCLGFGDCANICPEHAIKIINGVARVNTWACIGCGMCAKTCPNKLIALKPADAAMVVTCSNKEKGAATRKECSNGCIGCHKCERECPSHAITVKDNVSRIDYSKCTNCGHCAEICPVGCIKTVPVIEAKKAG